MANAFDKSVVYGAGNPVAVVPREELERIISQKK